MTYWFYVVWTFLQDVWTVHVSETQGRLSRDRFVVVLSPPFRGFPSVPSTQVNYMLRNANPRLVKSSVDRWTSEDGAGFYMLELEKAPSSSKQTPTEKFWVNGWLLRAFHNEWFHNRLWVAFTSYVSWTTEQPAVFSPSNQVETPEHLHIKAIQAINIYVTASNTQVAPKKRHLQMTMKLLKLLESENHWKFPGGWISGREYFNRIQACNWLFHFRCCYGLYYSFLFKFSVVRGFQPSVCNEILPTRNAKNEPAHKKTGKSSQTSHFTVS